MPSEKRHPDYTSINLDNQADIPGLTVVIFLECGSMMIATLPNIGTHVVDACQCHFLLDQSPFFVRDFEIDTAAFDAAAFSHWRKSP